METIVNIGTFFPAFISSRKSIELLQTNVSLSRNGKYIFDFNGIYFISRSFADEFLKYIQKNTSEFEINNANSTITEMFNAVKKTQNPAERYFNTIPITSFKRGVELNGLLATL